MSVLMQRIFVLVLLLASLNVWSANKAAPRLFGYQELFKSNLELFPQWLSVLDRHIRDLAPEGSCRSRNFNRCHLKEWLTFLDRIRGLSDKQKILEVNNYANTKPYILDIKNYSVEDYWATPKEFLLQSGDCEDFAIIKMLSLKELGFDTRKMRVVVVQDTNLKIPHAVMSLERNGDILILDNQIKEVISHQHIFHYVPVYSVNESNWWMHLPN